MTQRQGTAQFVAGAALIVLSGCGTVELFGEYDIPESPDVAAAPWPKLVEVPEAPPVGEYTENVPDPAQGVAVQADLSAIASSASARAAALAGPVIGEDERSEMLARASRSR
jgi:hypothetical protein